MAEPRSRAWLAAQFPNGHRWPAELRLGEVSLRPIRRRDGRAWREVRERNRVWLQPWEATVPAGSTGVPRSFGELVRILDRQGRENRSLPWLVHYEVPGEGERLVGQLTVSGITFGSACFAHIGYWVDERWAGRGITPAAVALATDYCMGVMGLHRIEVAIRPENGKSLRVVEKLGFRPEGLRPAYLHINGDWRDHLTFALHAEEIPDGLLARLPGRDGSTV